MNFLFKKALCVSGCAWSLIVIFSSCFIILCCLSVAYKTIAYSKVQGTIVESGLASYVNSRGVSFFKPDVCIAYSTTNGTCFTRKVLPFGRCSSSIRFIAENTSRDFIKGQPRFVYYNNDVSDSFVCHFGCFEILVLFFGALLFIGGALVFYFCLVHAKELSSEKGVCSRHGYYDKVEKRGNIC